MKVLEGALEPVLSPSVGLAEEANPNPNGFPRFPPGFGALGAEEDEAGKARKLPAGLSGDALKDEGRPLPIPVSDLSLSCSFISSDSFGFEKRLLENTETGGGDEGSLDEGAKGLAIESDEGPKGLAGPPDELGVPKLNTDFVGAGGGLLEPNANPGAFGTSLSGNGNGFVVELEVESIFGTKPPPVEGNVDEEVEEGLGNPAKPEGTEGNERAGLPAKLNAEDGGAGGAFVVDPDVFSALTLLSYSD